MTLKTIFDLTISTLTPLHIGNGETLERDFDYAVHGKNTWVINQDVFAEQMLLDENGRLVESLLDKPPGRILNAADFQESSKLFRYNMRGRPVGGRTGSAIQAQIKDVYDRPYIPGSSLKGALRTVIVRKAFADKNRKLTPSVLGRSRSWAARDLERDLMGKDPNHDLLRGLQISDSSELSPSDNLLVLNAQVFGRKSAGAPISIEAVRADAVFTATMTIDEYVFEQGGREIGQKRSWLEALPQQANEQSLNRVQQEMAFYQQHTGSRAAGFYRQLAGLMQQPPSDAFIIQVGWGGGWDSKTLGYLVAPAEREALIGRYNLAKGSRSKGDPFPKSRRAIAGRKNDQPTPLSPLGWLLVQMVKRI